MTELLFRINFNDASQDFDTDLSAESQDIGVEFSEAHAFREAITDHGELTNRDLPDQHPIAAISGLEDALNEILQDKHFVFSQPSASAVWEISHPLGKMPSVTVVDSAGSVVVGEICFESSDKVIVTFSGAFSGKAYLN